jgi:hypothetical protein
MAWYTDGVLHEYSCTWVDDQGHEDVTISEDAP